MNNNSITLPVELFDGRLSLQEIGVIGVIMSSPHQSKEIIDKWDNDVTLKSTLDEMVDRQILVREDGKIIINIEEPKYKNMKIEQALNELFEAGVLDGDNKSAIRDILEEVSADFYHMGYEDGRVDFQEETPFTAYGKREDFTS